MTLPRINTEVTLNAQEQALCRALARKRHATNRKEGVRNPNRAKQSDQGTGLEGVGSEFAFAKLFNVYSDFSFSLRNSAKDDGDCK